MLTEYQRAVLAHVVIDPDAWLAHAIAEFGEDAATEAMEAKVARVAPDYEAALTTEGAGYRTRAERSADEVGPGPQG